MFKSLPSPEIDKILGFDVIRIETELLKKAKDLTPDGNMHSWGKNLHNGSQTWIGLDFEEIQTPYNELALALEIIKPKENSKLVDLGAGYGRLGFVLNVVCPSATFIGHEIVKERVEEGNRVFKMHKLKNAKLEYQDLSKTDYILPLADYYFIYDFGQTEHIRKIIDELSLVADKRPIKVIARGKFSRNYIQNHHPWLALVNAPVHEERFSVYFS